MPTRLDIFFLVFLGLSIANAVRNGLLKTAVDFCSVFISIYAASYFAENLALAGQAGPQVNNLSYIYYFATFWFLIYIALGFISYIILKLIKVSFMGVIDLIGSLILGFCKSIVILGLILWVILSVPLPNDIIAEAKTSAFRGWTIPILSYSYNALFNLVPKNNLLPRPQGKPEFTQEEISPEQIKENIKKDMPILQEDVKKQLNDGLENNK